MSSDATVEWRKITLSSISRLDFTGSLQKGADIGQGLNLLVVHSKPPRVTIVNRSLSLFRLIS